MRNIKLYNYNATAMKGVCCIFFIDNQLFYNNHNKNGKKI